MYGENYSRMSLIHRRNISIRNSQTRNECQGYARCQAAIVIVQWYHPFDQRVMKFNFTSSIFLLFYFRQSVFLVPSEFNKSNRGWEKTIDAFQYVVPRDSMCGSGSLYRWNNSSVLMAFVYRTFKSLKISRKLSSRSERESYVSDEFFFNRGVSCSSNIVFRFDGLTSLFKYFFLSCPLRLYIENKENLDPLFCNNNPTFSLYKIYIPENKKGRIKIKSGLNIIITIALWSIHLSFAIINYQRRKMVTNSSFSEDLFNKKKKKKATIPVN